VTSPLADSDPRRWRILAVLAVAELLGMSLWFGANAVASDLGARWSLDTSQIGWLTSVVQLGFVVGTALAALLNIADIVSARWYFATAATAGGLANLGLIAVESYTGALMLRFATGLFLAGVYPPAMKMASTWFRAQRGLAIGTVVGALVIGKSTPYLIHALPDTSSALVVIVASGGAFLSAALIVAAYHDGPYAFPTHPFSFGLVGSVWSSREWRLATGGYLGHMFELYSFWTWIAAFSAASLLASNTQHVALVSLIAFLAIAAGGVGSIWGGLAADRRGREWLVTISMIASGTCALLSPLVFGHGRFLLIVLAVIWGFFVVADSAQFSALVTESVPSHAVGTALTLQTSAGFLLTMLSIQLVPPVVAGTSWQWAFPILALGPVAGVASIRALIRLRQNHAT
jgi:MFS family permease